MLLKHATSAELFGRDGQSVVVCFVSHWLYLHWNMMFIKPSLLENKKKRNLFNTRDVPGITKMDY